MKNNKPLVSVIIHSYNRFEYLINAIKSVEIQNIDNLELILLNDESTEKEYYEYNFPSFVKKIDITRSSLPNWRGSRQALINIGSSNANGKFLAFLDDDDIWLPNKLSKQIKLMEEKKFKFSSTEGYFGEGIYDKSKNYQLYNKEKFYKKISKKYKGTKYRANTILNTFTNTFYYPKVWTYDFLKHHNCVIASSTMVEKNLMNILGGFRGIPTSMAPDYDCWLGLLKLTDLIYIDEPLFYYDGAHGSGQQWR